MEVFYPVKDSPAPVSNPPPATQPLTEIPMPVQANSQVSILLWQIEIERHHSLYYSVLVSDCLHSCISLLSF